MVSLGHHHYHITAYCKITTWEISRQTGMFSSENCSVHPSENTRLFDAVLFSTACPHKLLSDTWQSKSSKKDNNELGFMIWWWWSSSWWVWLLRCFFYRVDQTKNVLPQKKSIFYRRFARPNVAIFSIRYYFTTTPNLLDPHINTCVFAYKSAKK